MSRKTCRPFFYFIKYTSLYIKTLKKGGITFMPKQKTKIEQLIKLKKQWEEIAKKYTDKAVKDLNKIGRLEVWNWYRSYSPKTYRRKKTLYYGFKITENNGDITIHFGSEQMYKIHFVDKYDPTYIFENSFIGGFHGGAIDGPDHPNPGVPYWRTPPPHYPFWSVPAKRDESPYDRIKKSYEAYENKIADKIYREYKKKIEIPAIEIILGK